MVGIFAILFAGNALSTINKSEVFWSATKENSFIPTPTDIAFNSESKSMFSIGLIGVNLNDPNIRYFDFDLMLTKIVNGAIGSIQSINL